MIADTSKRLEHMTVEAIKEEIFHLSEQECEQLFDWLEELKNRLGTARWNATSLPAGAALTSPKELTGKSTRPSPPET